MPTNTLTPSDLKEIANKINEGIEAYSIQTLKDKPRTHLGISEIGNECIRETWYKFRWMKFQDYIDKDGISQEGRMLRLFKRGHREEERFINYLEGIGCVVERFDETGKQFRISGILGHYGGSCDGRVRTPWTDAIFLLEMKTHNTKSFVEYINKGLHKSKPVHFDQMSAYGFEMGLEYGIYFPENKNDDMIQVEVVKLDHNRGKQLRLRAEDIITAKEAPARISDNPAFWKCTFCTFKGICHYNELPIKNCRSCRLATAVDGGEWHCGRWNSIIPSSYVSIGCEGWTPI